MTIKTFPGVLTLTFGLPVLAAAQVNVTGTWVTEGSGDPWRVGLWMDGPRLTGRVSSCGLLPVAIFDGRVDGAIVRFKCKDEDRNRVVTLTGTIRHDEIAFRWTAEPERTGSPEARKNVRRDDGDAEAMFGESTPRDIVARRASPWGQEFATALNFPRRNLKIEGTIFLPPRIRRVRAVIVLFNSGLSWEGMGGAYYRDPELRKLAATLDCGILLPRVSNIQNDMIGLLQNADLGAGESIPLLLDRLASESGHSELRDTPIVLWAHSRTGQLAATFASRHPQRTVGMIGYHIGLTSPSRGTYGQMGRDQAFLKLPVLILLAKADVDEFTIEGPLPAERVWRRGRSAGAPWTFGIEPGAAHQNPRDLTTANALVLPWLTAVLRQRLSANDRLRNVTEDAGWLGDIHSGEVAPAATYSGSKTEASWLPDEASARGWQVVVGATK
jgi:hypothetical protein